MKRSIAFERKDYRLRLRSRALALGGRTLIMGIVNVTPDSFSDGGEYLDSALAIARGFELEAAGADLLDIGGESTRPGAIPVSAEEELARVLPVIEGLRGKVGIPISVDTRKAVVAEAGLKTGAEMINDVSGLRHDPQMGEVVRSSGAAVVLMHMRGTPTTMQKGPFARDVLADVTAGLRAAARRAANAGIPKEKILLDPGLGFGKRYEQNFELLRRLAELSRLGFPLLVGSSRKAFLGWALGRKGKGLEKPWPKERRDWATAAAVTAAILGGAHIVRVHDVAAMAQVARVADAVAAR